MGCGASAAKRNQVSPSAVNNTHTQQPGEDSGGKNDVDNRSIKNEHFNVTLEHEELAKEESTLEKHKQLVYPKPVAFDINLTESESPRVLERRFQVSCLYL